MQHVVLYPPIDRDVLELIFQNEAVAMSFKKESFSGAFSLTIRDASIFKKYQMSHSVVSFTDMKEQVEAKNKKHLNT